MALAQFPELRKLTKNQKLRLAEELWLDTVDDTTPVSAKHRAILDSRWKAYRTGKTKRISLEQLEHRLSQR